VFGSPCVVQLLDALRTEAGAAAVERDRGRDLQRLSEEEHLQRDQRRQLVRSGRDTGERAARLVLALAPRCCVERDAIERDLDGASRLRQAQHELGRRFHDRRARDGTREAHEDAPEPAEVARDQRRNESQGQQERQRARTHGFLTRVDVGTGDAYRPVEWRATLPANATDCKVPSGRPRVMGSLWSGTRLRLRGLA
jgi:hypothetical protein